MSTVHTTIDRAGTIRVRRAAERGHFDHGWLDTFHTFSFGAHT